MKNLRKKSLFVGSIIAFLILITSNTFSQEQRLVHRYFVQSSYYKDTILKRISKQDENVKLLVDSAEKYRKRVLPKLILSGLIYGIGLSQLPNEYVSIGGVPLYDYKSMEQRSYTTILLSGVAFFSAINPIVKKDYYISNAYKAADLKYPYIPFIQKPLLKKYDINKFKKLDASTDPEELINFLFTFGLNKWQYCPREEVSKHLRKLKESQIDVWGVFDDLKLIGFIKKCITCTLTNAK